MEFVVLNRSNNIRQFDKLVSLKNSKKKLSVKYCKKKQKSKVNLLSFGKTKNYESV